MKIYYQWNPGSYMHTASRAIAEKLSVSIQGLEWKPEFHDVWESIGAEGIAVLAIENSYMGSIYPNLQGFMKYDYKIIGEYHLPIRHCLCSHETDISQITKAYSQIPALEQCHKYLKQKNIQPIKYSDTALSAKHVSETDEPWSAAICSELAADIYGLNILEKNIQDHQENTTRFIIIVPKDSTITYADTSDRVSLLFETRHIPASLYKCLWAFATNNVNLTKLESIPSFKGNFSCLFWLDFEGSLDDENIQKTLEELEFFTSTIRILGQY